MSEPPRPFFTRPLPVVLIILLLVVLDQASKYAVEQYLPFQVAVPVVPTLYLYRTYNLGVAFSLLADTSGFLIVTMRLAIVAFVLWLWRRTGPERFLAHPGFALIVAGAIGNIIDRFVYGHVIDYVLFSTGSWSFAVFNLADSFITIGAILVVLDELLSSKKTKA